jgi:glycosyltransferase involved in cell wall biosynthesis
MKGNALEKKVVFVHRVTCDYSEAFLVKTHNKLKANGIVFQVVSGQPWKNEALTDVVSNLCFGHRSPNRKIIGPLYWARGVLSHIKNADLVIIEQLNTAVHNYLILFLRHFRSRLWNKYRFKTAYYGHGLNLNSQSVKFQNRLKKKMSLWVDWWFAYTELTKKIIYRDGYHNITVMNNTVDTTSLTNEIAKYTRNDINEFYKEVFDTHEHQPTAVFCGRLVELKWIPFLLQALEIIKRSLPGFRMVIIGSGPYSEKVEEFCKQRNWCKYVGSKTGIEKVKYLLLGNVWLNPGGVGLAVVDSFAFGLPLITTDNKIHGPEISYLDHGRNGIVTKPVVDEYANCVVDVLNNDSLLNSLKLGSLESSKKYSIDSMVNNFVDGILKCLNLEGK